MILPRGFRVQSIKFMPNLKLTAYLELTQKLIYYPKIIHVHELVMSNNNGNQ